MIKRTLLALVAGSMLSISAQAGVVFEDNFDLEAGAAGSSALNYNNFDQWSVSNGTVDVVSNGGWGIHCAGNTGKCVDLDGSTHNAGMFSSDTFNLAAGIYSLSFDISGNQRTGSNDNLQVTLDGFFNQSFNLAYNSLWQTVTHTFTVNSDTSNNLTFNHAGGDNIGIMLDNVSLHSVEVPEPGTFALFALGLAGVGFLRKNQKV
ncbi:PEP-CTERM domain protein [Gammaproteobacteria bacterium 42_54_T18]|nr:PEP-CTERM domain protein [Gammaproteobacteria bacterium 42_54_T18]